MTLGKKLTLSLLGIAFVPSVFGFLALWGYWDIHRESSLLRDEILPSAVALLEVKGGLATLANEAEEVAEGRGERSEIALRTMADIRENMAVHASHGAHAGGKERQRLKVIEGRAGRIIRLAEQLLKLAEAGGAVEELRGLQRKMHAEEEALAQILDKHVAVHMRNLAEAQDKLRRAAVVGTWSIGVAVAVGFVLAAAVGFQTARSVVRPIHLLHRGVERIGSGDLTYRVNIRTGDEIERLAGEFNRMADKLSESYSSLERKVAERTAELSGTNEELKREVAERRRAEATLAEERNLLRTLIDNVPDCHIFVKDAESRFVTTNAAHLKTLGAERLDEVIGKTDFAFFPRELAERYYADERKVISSGQPLVDREEPVLDRTGKRKWLLTTKVPLRDGAGGITGLIGMSRNISELKRAEEALQQKTVELARSNEELEQFASVASHDLQEPLRMVSSFTQLLAKHCEGKLGNEEKEFMGYIVDGATRMQVLIDDLLAYSRVATRRKPFQRTDCNEALSWAIKNLHVMIEERGAAITHAPLPSIVGDARQLGQLFQNLVGNAVKFHAERPPRVHVSADGEGNEWTFSVRDNGIGIHAKDAERIFVIFQRLHGRREYAGTGIGLAICRKIVERHNGRIWVRSQPGKGSTFYFTIPKQETSDHGDADARQAR
jgi:PAS domain S-box-containing protein